MSRQFEHKSQFGCVEYGLPIHVEEQKTVGDQWEVAGYCSTFNDEDRVGDIVLPGAFDKALAGGEQTLFLYCHKLDQMLGVPLVLKQDQKGLFGRFRISRTPLGESVHTLMDDGAPFGFSIGFFPDEFAYNDAGNRLLKQIDLVENTLAPAPLIANPQARVTAFKTLLGLDGLEQRAVWSVAFVNSLPDEAFAGVEPGGTKDESGLTTPRSLRHLPHHNSSVKNGSENSSVDAIHLRNALSRVEQMQDGGSEFRAKCRNHLIAHAKALGIGDYGDGGNGKTVFSLSDFDPAEMPFDAAWQDIVQIVTKGVEHAKALHARRGATGREFGPRHTESLTTALAALEGASADVKQLLAAQVATAEASPASAKASSGELAEVQRMKADLWRKLERHPELVL